jgi:hypothetical protein
MLRTALALACLLLGLVAVPAANAATPTQILRDCADDGVLQGSYSPADLRRARQNIPADTDEYTDCRDVLARAATAGVAASGGGGGGLFGGGAGGGSPPLENANTPEGRAIVGEAAAKGEPDPLQLDGRPVIPGTAGLAAGAARNDLPTMLIIVLALLGAAAVAAAAPYVRRRVLTRFGR